MKLTKRQRQRSTLHTLSTDELDETVHELKSAEAAAINNHGREAQIEYILANTEPESIEKPIVSPLDYKGLPWIPRVLIDMTGGFVESIQADGLVETLIIDHDETDDEEQKQVRVINGEETYFWILDPEEIVEPSVLDPYFEAAKEVRKEVLNGDDD
ncbi:MAG: hypothetical protein PHP56_12860 [Smithellaceae bacterium]|nr:hypothetical protein [Smithellaceae bacterium]